MKNNSNKSDHFVLIHDFAWKTKRKKGKKLKHRRIQSSSKVQTTNSRQANQSIEIINLLICCDRLNNVAKKFFRANYDNLKHFCSKHLKNRQKLHILVFVFLCFPGKISREI